MSDVISRNNGASQRVLAGKSWYKMPAPRRRDGDGAGGATERFGFMAQPSTTIPRISRQNLTREVVDSIAKMILNREWRPGDAIPTEMQLADQFGVGRSTIREALQSLVTLGVIEIRRGEGTFVRQPDADHLSGAFHWGLLLSPRNLDEFVQFRRCVESQCAADAARAPAPELADELQGWTDRMGADWQDHARYMEWDNRFHIGIAKATGNQVFVRVVETVQSIVRLWFPATYRLSGTVPATTVEHDAIIAAVRAGDSEAARRAMVTHILTAGERLGMVMGDGPDEPRTEKDAKR